MLLSTRFNDKTFHFSVLTAFLHQTEDRNSIQFDLVVLDYTVITVITVVIIERVLQLAP